MQDAAQKSDGDSVSFIWWMIHISSLPAKMAVYERTPIVSLLTKMVNNESTPIILITHKEHQFNETLIHFTLLLTKMVIVNVFLRYYCSQRQLAINIFLSYMLTNSELWTYSWYITHKDSNRCYRPSCVPSCWFHKIDTLPRYPTNSLKCETIWNKDHNYLSLSMK